jgi:hypothetical protein
MLQARRTSGTTTTSRASTTTDQPENDPDPLLAELGRTWEEFAAAERRARTALSQRGVRDQTARDVRALLREAADGAAGDPETA